MTHIFQKCTNANAPVLNANAPVLTRLIGTIPFEDWVVHSVGPPFEELMEDEHVYGDGEEVIESDQDDKHDAVRATDPVRDPICLRARVRPSCV